MSVPRKTSVKVRIALILAPILLLAGAIEEIFRLRDDKRASVVRAARRRAVLQSEARLSEELDALPRPSEGVAFRQWIMVLTQQATEIHVQACPRDSKSSNNQQHQSLYQHQ